MVLDYLKESKKSVPEIKMKAESLINIGYQRLLTFEVDGGGFSWFGEAPAHPMLTAYGLMEFRDMSRVYDVDEKIIDRTQKWLCSKQAADGSFELDHREMHSGPQSGGRVVLNTAYITWALLESGYKGITADRAAGFLKKHIDDASDPYTLALIVNALGLYNRDDRDTRRALDKLIKMAVISGDSAKWTCTSTATCGYGESGNVETTALAAQAILRFSGEAGLLQNALNYIVSCRDSGGTWGSTQATVLALRVLVESQKKPVKRSGKLEIVLNGKPHSTFVITPETSDVLQMADLRDSVITGDNKVDILLRGEGSYMYQIVGKYYLPWKGGETKAEPKLGIQVNYDRTTLTSEDILNAEAAITYRGDETSSMVIADLGIPPGFTVLTGDFDNLKAKGTISRYEVTPRKVIVYLMGLSSGARVSLPYRLKAKFPIKAKTPPSKVYEYYNPESQFTDNPKSLTVK